MLKYWNHIVIQYLSIVRPTVQTGISVMETYVINVVLNIGVEKFYLMLQWNPTFQSHKLEWHNRIF
jgi:hypothetical protein